MWDSVDDYDLKEAALQSSLKATPGSFLVFFFLLEGNL